MKRFIILILENANTRRGSFDLQTRRLRARQIELGQHSKSALGKKDNKDAIFLMPLQRYARTTYIILIFL